MAVKAEELYKALNGLKEAIQEGNKEAAKKAAEDALKNAPQGNRLTEFPVEAATGLVDLHKSFSKDPRVVEFQKRADDLFIVSKVLGIDPRQSKLYKDFQEPVSELRKAMTTATTGGGAEWIPTGFSADLIGKVEMALKVAALHPRVKMPTDPFKVPALTGFSTARLGGTEGSASPTVSALTTSNVVLNAVKLITYVGLSYELEEDSIIAVLPLIKDDIVKALARAQDNAAINGDTSASHMDSDVTDAEDVRKAWNGYRDLAISAAKVDCAGAISDTKLRAVRKAMGKYGVDQNELAWVVGISGYNQMLGLSEVITVDKYGPNATVLTGELAKFDGIPVVVSEYVREDLNGSGVYDGSTKTKTIVLLVRKDGFFFGDRRDVLIETDRNIKVQTTDLVASQRVAFMPRLPSTDPIVGLLYDITA
jgi:HK97 family phage major capsid protein